MNENKARLLELLELQQQIIKQMIRLCKETEKELGGSST